jgi:hypothetical protein
MVGRAPGLIPGYSGGKKRRRNRCRDETAIENPIEASLLCSSIDCFDFEKWRAA